MARFPGLEQSAPAAPRRTARFPGLDGGDPTPAPDTASALIPESDPPASRTLLGILGAGAAGAVGLGLRKYGGVGLLEKLNELRQQMMLTGLAIPKATLGSAGGATIASVERGSLKPLKELFSRQTLRDIGTQYKAGAPGHIQAATQTGKAMHGPGRALGAIDNAFQGAMKRAGVSPEYAEELAFQTPLGKHYGPFGEALDSPVMRYLQPFRRSPFNQYFLGARETRHAMGGAPMIDARDARAIGMHLAQGVKGKVPMDQRLANIRRALLYSSAGVGAAHGAATADERFPLTMGLGLAAANRYALPYAAGAIAGRTLAGGLDPTALAGEVLPISEYGLGSGIADPTQAFTRPAFIRLAQRLGLISGEE